MNRYITRACLTSAHPLTYTPEHMAEAWDILEAEGRVPFLFYDGYVRNRENYIDFMSQPDVFSYAVYDTASENLLCVYWLNNFMGRTGMMHFAYTKAGSEERYAIGRMVCRFLIEGGMSALIGVTPKPFRHAWQFALAVGYKKVGELPQACVLRTTGKERLTDAVISVCTKETLLPE